MPRMTTAALLALAQDAVDGGQIDAACEFFEVALAQDSNNPDVLEAYAEIMVHFVGDPQRAEQMLRHAINSQPDQGHIKYMNLAQLCQGHEALALYQKAIDILQGDLAMARKKKQKLAFKRIISSARCAIAELYLTDLCDEEGAEGHCEAAVADAKMYCEDNVEAWQVEGSLRISQQRTEDAITSLLRALHLSRTLPESKQPTYESKIELGKLLIQVSPVEAFRWLLEVLQMDDSNPYVWFLLSEAARARNRLHDAARLLKRARMMVDPSNEEAVSDIDAAIHSLVELIGGEAAVNEIPHMDKPNPLEYLEPEDDDDGEDGGGEAEVGVEDELDPEPEWGQDDEDEEQ